MKFIGPVLFYGFLLGWGAYLLNRHRKTRDTRYLNSLGNYVFFLTFCGCLFTAPNAVLFPERLWQTYAIMLGGAFTGMLLQAAHYQGWRKLHPVWHTLVFLAVANFCAMSMNYFREPVLVTHARQEVAKVVPEAAQVGRDVFAPGQKKELAVKLTAALSNPDRYVQLGALYCLVYLKEDLPASLPAMLPLLASQDEDLLKGVLAVLNVMGPAAADARPALQEKLNRMKPDDRYYYRVEELLKKVSTTTVHGAGN